MQEKVHAEGIDFIYSLAPSEPHDAGQAMLETPAPLRGRRGITDLEDVLEWDTRFRLVVKLP